MRSLAKISLLLALLLPLASIAQSEDTWECSWGRFIRGSRILFQDSLNTFSTQWQTEHTADGLVKNVAGKSIRCFYSNNVNAIPASRPATGKWVTFECDFILNDSMSSFQVVLTYGTAGERKIVIDHHNLLEQWHGEHEDNYGIGSFGASLNCRRCFQADVNKWHRLALIFSRDCMDAFVDGKRLIGLGHDTGSNPRFVGYRPANFYLAGKGPYAVADIIFAESEQLPTNFTASFDDLLVKKKLATRAIFFEYNKTDIRPESMEFLYQLSEWIKEHLELKLKIIGHTDNVGSPEFNQKLSEERANRVKNWLISSGIRATRLSALGAGGTQPLKPNTTEDGRVINRRVEFVIE